MCKYGLAKNVLSDQGPNFMAQLLELVWELLDIMRLRTTPCHPQTDGLSERFIQTLKQMITASKDLKSLNLNKLAYAYNSSVHSTTGFTPFEIQFDMKPKLPLDLIISSPISDGLGLQRRDVDTITVGDDGCVTALADCEGLYHRELPRSAKIYVENLKASLLKVYQDASKNIDYNVNISKIFFDKNIKPTHYQVGDLVLTDHVKIKVGLRHELTHKYHRPFKILAKHPNGVDYLIRKEDSQRERKFLIHHNRLKKYFCKIDKVPGPDVSIR